MVRQSTTHSAKDTPSPEKKAALYNQDDFIHVDDAADVVADKKITADDVEVCLDCCCHLHRAHTLPGP
jgi:hypothetical protein